MTYMQKYRAWLNDPAVSGGLRAELIAIESDEKEIEDRFYTELQFGTAGLRGVLGAGTNRMNELIVGRATQGLADYLLRQSGSAQKGITVAYDSRRMSPEFARRTAEVLCGNGIRTYLFDTIHGVPQLSFALQYYGCAGGVLITASHNPKEYNGYKVYGANGAQIGPDMAQEVTRCIEAVGDFAQVRLMEEDEAAAQGLLQKIGQEVDEAYFSYVKGLVVDPRVMQAAHAFKVVYTPLHGSGNVPVRRILADAGIKELYVVSEQEAPDGEFPTVSAPNPEARDAFDMARALAEEKGAELLLATDPDADRLGVVVKDGGEYVALSGNQIGCIILNYRLKKLSELGLLPENGFVVKSIVSTNLANAICAKYGVEIFEVLTGFRYIGEKIDASQRTGDGSFLFGFEESFGYLAGTRVRDKDAICAALMLTEAAAWYSTRGMNLKQGLDEIFAQYGYYKEAVQSFTLYGKEGMEKISAAMEGLRANPPEAVAGVQVAAIRDYKARKRTDLRTGEAEPVSLPSSNVLYFELADGGWVCARPSGTEPKLKIYANASAPDDSGAQAKVDGLLSGMGKALEPYLR